MIKKISKVFRVFPTSHLLLATLFGVVEVNGYSQISMYGGGTNDEGPKIFKAINADLIFPETFNSSNNVISTTQTPLKATKATKATTPTTTTLATFPTHYPQDSVTDTAIPLAPVIYVTPPTQTSFTPQVHNDQTIESDRTQSDYPKQLLREETYDDYPKQLLREETYESVQTNDKQKQKQEEHQELQEQQQHHQQQFTSTGRAVDYRPAYQLDQFMNAAKQYKGPPPSQPKRILRPTAASYTVRPHKGQTTQYNSAKILPYPQSSSSSSGSYRHEYQRPKQVFYRPSSQAEIYKLGGRGQISDRFTPGEAVASTLFTKNNQKHNHGNKVASSSNIVQSYTNPKDLYSFPPNINAKYPKPSDDSKAALASISVNSYAPPAAGPIKAQLGYPLVASASNNAGYQYNGPVNPDYLAPNGVKDEKPKDGMDTKPMESDTDTEDGDDTIGVLPASAMDTGGNGNNDQGVTNDMKNMNDMNAMSMDNAHDHDHEHEHDHPPIGYDTGKEYPTPPPGWVEEHPEHDHIPSLPYFPHHYPEILYDDHHHDFHYDHLHPIELPSTTIPPPPEPLPSEQPQEPRVKKYSYFYIGRKLWYIPLYFTIWFSFYVLWLILKSIARHKVNLPNHYQAKRSIRSLPYLTDETAKEYINNLTVSVLQQIENFQKNYIT